ncbi:MAG: ROK family protein [Phaeodactylibacter xiamenensis]|uniref:Transcriptional regulator n=1 Tax=Phaeodactylibacter xiamenensis TaxID=1524460 RepID=A0A098S2Z6_9BACT|nr:ROK family protein [Phaeodactylibacter xiamenensis]KGE85567.1 transcriptional regulator [Phaeodactylibacter xiamenensis]MCR9051690.1 ROK family protein [bacterium]
MNKLFLTEQFNDSISGVAYKSIHQKKRLLAYFAEHGPSAIGDLRRALHLSVPKVTALLNELMEEQFVKDYGKDNSTGGRPPNLYDLAAESAYFLGVDVHRTFVNIALTDFQKNIVKIKEQVPYTLSNTQESLDALCLLIKSFMKELGQSREKILGIGVNLTGRVNSATGFSYSFFHFEEQPLSEVLKDKLGIQVVLENDSRAMAYGEFAAGVVEQERNVLFLNLDYGIGMGMVLDGQLYYGKSGYSGEVGHMPVFDNNIICQCGKKGCLETEASGWALEERFKTRVRNGATTQLVQNQEHLKTIDLEAIIQVAESDDVLAIELIAEIGEQLGRGIAALINVFNPELVVLGGSLAATGDYIRLPLLSALNKYSLSLVSNDTALKVSNLGNRAGVLGACLLVQHRFLATKA